MPRDDARALGDAHFGAGMTPIDRTPPDYVHRIRDVSDLSRLDAVGLPYPFDLRPGSHDQTIAAADAQPSQQPLDPDRRLTPALIRREDRQSQRSSQHDAHIEPRMLILLAEDGVAALASQLASKMPHRCCRVRREQRKRPSSLAGIGLGPRGSSYWPKEWA